MDRLRLCRPHLQYPVQGSDVTRGGLKHLEGVRPSPQMCWPCSREPRGVTEKDHGRNRSQVKNQTADLQYLRHWFRLISIRFDSRMFVCQTVSFRKHLVAYLTQPRVNYVGGQPDRTGLSTETVLFFEHLHVCRCFPIFVDQVGISRSQEAVTVPASGHQCMQPLVFGCCLP